MSNFVFNLKNIEPLDIILVKGSGVIGKTIRKLDGGNISHAMLHKFNGVCIEAMRPNVVNYDLARSKCESPKNIKILRHQTLNIEAKINAAKEIDKLFGRKYSLLPYAISTENNKGIFCSMLVAHSYQNLNVKLNNKKFNKVTPKDIEDDKNFVDITKTILINNTSSASPLGYDYIEKRDLNPTQRSIQKSCYNMAMSEIEFDYRNLCKEVIGKSHKETSIVSVISTLEAVSHKQMNRVAIHKKIKNIDTKIANSFKKTQLLKEIEAMSISELIAFDNVSCSMTNIEISNYINKSVEEIKDLNSINEEWGTNLKLKSAVILKDMRSILINYHNERISILERVQVNA